MRKPAFVLIGIIVILSGLWLASRALPPTQQEKTALAALSDRPGFEGSNAFKALWLLPYDVPKEEWDAVIAADIEAHQQQWQGWLQSNDSWPSGSTAEAHYPSLLPDPADRDLFCRPAQHNCLDHVRADVDAIAALVTRHEPLLDRMTALASHDYLQSVFPPHLPFLTPGFQINRYLQTRHALDFVEGRVDEALADTCTHLLAWRRLGTHSDTLIMRLIGHAHEMQHSAVLLADMLAELPSGHPLPATCETIQEPPALEALSICQPLQGEFQLLAAANEVINSPANQPADTFAQRARQPLHRLLFNAEATNARLAPSYGQWCSDELQAAIPADDPAPAMPEPAGRFNLRCLSNLLGCQLSDMGSVHMVAYHVRHLDYGAQRRALSSLIWLHQNAVNGDFADAFARLPAELQSDTRPVRLEADQRRIAVALHNPSETPEFSLPLPGSRFSPAETNASFP